MLCCYVAKAQFFVCHAHSNASNEKTGGKMTELLLSSISRSGEKVHKNEWLPKALGFESRSHTFAPFLPPFCYFLQEMGLIEVEVAARRRV